MAYFECTTGMGAGGGATITVTYNSSFYNKTMTCSNGIKTYTKTTTSSGSTEFNVSDEGTWTITCNGISRTVYVTLNYSTAMAITKTVTVYGAAGATISFTDAVGAKTVTLNNSGQGSVSITFIPPSQTITFTDTNVAKNPDNLSQNYSKSITITESTTSIKVMPDNALYWYGYKNVSYTIINTITITDNTNNETLSGGTTVDIAYVQRDLTGISSVVMILNSTTGGTEDSLWCNATAPTSPYGQWTPSIKTKYNTTTGNKKSIDVSSMTGNNYVGISLWYARALTYDALFME